MYVSNRHIITALTLYLFINTYSYATDTQLITKASNQKQPLTSKMIATNQCKSQ